MCINRCRLQSVSSRATVSRSVWRGRCHRLLACVVTLRERRPWTNPCTNRGRHHRSLRQAARTPTAQSCLGNRDAYGTYRTQDPFSTFPTPSDIRVCTRNTRTEMLHSPPRNRSRTIHPIHNAKQTRLYRRRAEQQ